jgi:hypothetical protein
VQFDKLVGSDLALGTLCDILRFALPLDVEFKQALLATPEVEESARRLEAEPAAAAAAQAGRKFPPEFSAN